jgi:tRNA modification GTPase
MGAVVHATSALTGEGIAALVDAVETKLAGNVPAEDSALSLSARHRSAVESALACLGRAREVVTRSADALGQAELVACELREAGVQLGLVVGALATDDLLARIFSRFCIGK